MINGSYAGDQLDLLATRTSPSSVSVRMLCFLPDAGRQDGVTSSPPPGAESPASRPPQLRPTPLAL